MGYGPEDANCVFELTHNWCEERAGVAGRGGGARLDPRHHHHRHPHSPRGQSSYNNMHGKGYAQVAISTTDVYKSAAQVEAAGGKITRAPGPVPGIGTKIVATTDPDGWKVVLVDEADFLAELGEERD